MPNHHLTSSWQCLLKCEIHVCVSPSLPVFPGQWRPASSYRHLLGIFWVVLPLIFVKVSIEASKLPGVSKGSERGLNFPSMSKLSLSVLYGSPCKPVFRHLPKLTWREQVILPLFQILQLNIKSGTDHPTLFKQKRVFFHQHHATSTCCAAKKMGPSQISTTEFW